MSTLPKEGKHIMGSGHPELWVNDAEVIALAMTAVRGTIYLEGKSLVYDGVAADQLVEPGKLYQAKQQLEASHGITALKQDRYSKIITISQSFPEGRTTEKDLRRFSQVVAGSIKMLYEGKQTKSEGRKEKAAPRRTAGRSVH